MIRRLPTIRLLAAILAAALGAGAALAETGRTQVFDVTVGGLRAGELTLSSERNGTTYTTGSTIRATGVLGALSRFRYDGTSTGTIAGDGSVVPAQHINRSRSSRSDRTTRIQFQNGEPARISMEPPRRRAIDPADFPGTIDPVSAAFAILLENRPENVCNARVDLFDGHRRSQVTVGRAEAASGGRLVCNGLYSRLRGDALPTTDDTEWGFRLFYRQNGDGRIALDRIEAPTRYGLAVVTPRR
jgi:hypothetical protein